MAEISTTEIAVNTCKEAVELIEKIELEDSLPLDFRLALLKHLRGIAQAGAYRIGQQLAEQEKGK